MKTMLIVFFDSQGIVHKEFVQEGCTVMCVLLFYVCIDVLTLDAGLLARSQYPESPATGHLDTGFLGFPVSISEC